jgi:hypothetical protein
MSDRSSRSTGQPPSGSPAKTHSLKERAASEIRKFLVLFVYLWVLFAMFILNQSIVLREQGFSVTLQGVALINALVLAKVMLLFEAWDPARWLRRRPLVYPILFEAFLLTILFLVVHVLEKVIHGLLHGATIAASLPSLGGGGVAGLLSVAVIMFVALVPFFAFRNLGLAIGEDRLTALVFGGPAAAPDSVSR